MKLYKTIDGGLTWNYVSAFEPRYATSIWFLDESKGFAGGYQNLLVTNDGGITWDLDNSVFSPSTLFFLDRNIGFVGNQNRINITTNGGNTWSYFGIPAFDFTPAKIYAYDINNIYTVGTAFDFTGDPFYIFYHTSNRGATWIAKIFEKQITDVFFETPTKGYVCAGEIFRTTDRGINWINSNYHALNFAFKGRYSWSSYYNTISYSNDGWLTSIPQIKSIFSGFLWDGCAKDTNIAFACGFE